MASLVFSIRLSLNGLVVWCGGSLNHSGIDDYQVYVNISRDRMGCHQERRVVRWTEPGWDEMGRALVDRQTNMIVVYARLLALGLYCGYGDGDGDCDGMVIPFFFFVR